MKKILFYLFALMIISGCSKEEKLTTPEFKEEGGKIQYPKGYMKEKIDSNDPNDVSVHILADLSTKNNSKDVVTTDFIVDLRFNIAYCAHNSQLYVEPNFKSLYAYLPDPEYYDLNQDAGGRYIYMYYTCGINSIPINKLWVKYGSGENDSNTCETPGGSDADLNAGAGGSYVWAQITHGFLSNHNLCGIGVIHGSSSSIQAPAGWEKIPGDLNKGAGGRYIYFIAKWR